MSQLSTDTQTPQLKAEPIDLLRMTPATLEEPYFDLPRAFVNPKRMPFTFDQHALTGLAEQDRTQFIRFGQGQAVEPDYSQIHLGFEAVAAAHPTLLAANHLGKTISYGELDRQANRLACKLSRLGVSTGDHVGLFLQRSIPMLAGILATLKAGAAYVPQHVGVAPDAHLRHVVDVANIKVILTISELADQVPIIDGVTVIAVDTFMQQPFAHDFADVIAFRPKTPITPDNTAFIIFTSGTTGNPNGVQVTHRNVCNILLTAPGNLGIKPGTKVAQILSIAFDMCAWETLGCLANGGTLIIRGRDFLAAAKQADVIISTPSILGTIDADQCHNVKTVAVAGEPCPRPLADKWGAFCNFYNSCGPTETTIINTAQHYLPSSERLTIGAPTPNNTVYVLNEDLQPCKIGEIGEMWAGGDCVSAGYIGNPELTAARYRPDPFLGNGRMMFRTRDLGRWTEDGELEHFGRTDDQVKIRGFRVELDSVSGALESTPGCEQAVTLKFDSRDLVAFVQPATVDVDAAKERVSAELPYYCTPKFVIALDQLPMTPRGKLDKRLLLKLAQEHDAATTQAEAA